MGQSILFLLLSSLAFWTTSTTLQSDSSLLFDFPLGDGDLGFTISRLTRAKDIPLVEASELKITENVINLRRATGDGVVSLSSMFVQAMRKGSMTGLERRQATSGSTALTSVEGGHVFVADITVGSNAQTFSVVIDTGSSDPWLAANKFSCFSLLGAAETEDYCEFGPLYNPSASTTFVPVNNQVFNISYADGEYLTGAVGLETVTMAGITVPNQQLGLVDQAAWLGDGTSSGLVGFAYRTLTSAYAKSSTNTSTGSAVLYNPLFVNMYTNQGVPPVFSLAIDRDPSNGGVMALGGLPDVPHVPYFANATIYPVAMNATSGDMIYEFYTILIDGYAVSKTTATQFNPYQNNNPLKMPLVANNTRTIVDSGTSLIYVPNDVANTTASLFDPPGDWNADYQAWYVDCTAVAPVFGVSIENKIFFTNQEDMIVQVSETECVSGVQPQLQGLALLGATWMKNVLVVFDIGAEEMRFAARQSYSASVTK